MTAVAAIVERVRRMAPNQPAEQRRLLARWAANLRRLDPGMADALLAVSLAPKLVKPNG